MVGGLAWSFYEILQHLLLEHARCLMALVRLSSEVARIDIVLDLLGQEPWVIVREIDSKCGNEHQATKKYIEKNIKYKKYLKNIEKGAVKETVG